MNLVKTLEDTEYLLRVIKQKLKELKEQYERS